ncbi:hypothetical protein ACHAWF_009185 [Thalassiosira exigua]
MAGVDRAVGVDALPGGVDGPRADADYDSQADCGSRTTSDSYVCRFNRESRRWECGRAEYKSDVLRRVMDAAAASGGGGDGGRAAIDQLKEFGITVYLAEHDGVDLPLLRQVVRHAAASAASTSGSVHGRLRCLLYRDEGGRLYNLTLDDGSSGLAEMWKGTLVTHSGLQAMAALTILARAFACAGAPDVVLRPGFVTIVLGLVLTEELGLAWLNISLFVRGTPSVAGHTLLSKTDSDWPRKGVVFLLATASAMEAGSKAQWYATLTGVGMAMALLAANLGARAWRFMRWRPVRSLGNGVAPNGDGFLIPLIAPVGATLVALVAGLVFPFMGYGRIQAGGRSAVRLVVLNSLLVAGIFVASDLDVLQEFLVVGSERCDQSDVNIALGIWLAMTSATCVLAARRVRPQDAAGGGDGGDDVGGGGGDPILVEEQSSPVGYAVPTFPSFPVDPTRLGGDPRWSCCALGVEVALGLLLSVGAGAFVVSTSLYDYVGTANGYIASVDDGAAELV